MTRTAALLLLLFTAPAPQRLSAQRLSAQRVTREFGVQGYLISGEVERFGGGVYGARRVGPRARISLFAGADRGAGSTAGRGEALVHFLLAPARKEGVGLYCAGGLAVDVATRTAARMVGVIGVEGRPGGRGGYLLEAGVGGGWRFAAGWRWRR